MGKPMLGKKVTDLIVNRFGFHTNEEVSQLNEKVKDLTKKLEIEGDNRFYYEQEANELKDRCTQLERWARESRDKYAREYAAVNGMRYALSRITTDEDIRAQLEVTVNENFDMFKALCKAEDKLRKIESDVYNGMKAIRGSNETERD